MLDKLIESTDNGKHTRKLRRFFLSIGTAVTGLCAFGLIFSIFTTSLAMGSDEIELSRLIAPAMIPESKPLPPEIKKEAAAKPSDVKIKIATRAQNIQRLDEAPVSAPKTVSTTQNKFKARPPGPVIFNGLDTDVSPVASPAAGRTSAKQGTSFVAEPTSVVEEPKTPKVEQPKVEAPPKLIEPKKEVILVSNIVNGKAINLVQPVVTAAIRSMNIKGTVRINVLISENGRVISATAGDGHALLRGPAITAARRSTFSPTILNGSPVKVRGAIVYNYN